MGYVTVQQLTEKHGSHTHAALEYLKGTLSDDEREAVEQRLNPIHILFAKMIILEQKVDLIIEMLNR